MLTANGTPPREGERGEYSLSKAQGFPEQIFELLPPLLSSAMGFFERKSQRDVFLTGAMPVLAGLMSHGVEIPCRDGLISPDVYACVVAPPSSGKGALRWAKRLGRETNARLYERSEYERREWELADKKSREPEPPPYRALYIAANSSSAAFFDALRQNGGGGCVFEEEIDTLSSSLGQDWGNFSDVLRKAFHHEDITSDRLGRRARIDHPRLSMLLAGTREQFLRLFQSAENGLFSRYGFYYFEDYAGWLSHRPQVYAYDREDYFRKASRFLDRMYQLLEHRARPVHVTLLPAQWDQHDETYAGLQGRITERGLPQALVSNVRRSGLTALRIAAVLRVARAFTEHHAGALNLERADTLTVTDDDLEAALWMSCTYVDHAIRMYALLENTPLTPAEGRMQEAYALLPETFGRGELLEVASKLGVSQRTMYNYRGEMLERGLIQMAAYGQYQKVPQELAALTGQN